jgi:hypothetical protein
MLHFIIPADRCAFLTCEGNYSLDEVTTAWREVQKVLAEREWERALVDFTALRTSPDTDGLFDLAKLFWRDFPPGGRIALVVRWDQSRLAKLLESLVWNFGLYLTAFVSEEQAEAWVLEGTQDEQAVEASAQ